jgi:hypothetical protein
MHRSLHVQMRANFGQRSGEFRPLIATVGEQLLKKGKHPKQGRHDENGTGHTMAFCNLCCRSHSNNVEGPPSAMPSESNFCGPYLASQTDRGLARLDRTQRASPATTGTVKRATLFSAARRSRDRRDQPACSGQRTSLRLPASARPSTLEAARLVAWQAQRLRFVLRRA